MLVKQNVTENLVQVTFSLPADVQAEDVYLVGDFNQWSETTHPMERDDDGSFVTTLELESGREYQFRYLVNKTEWHNDWKADRYVQNAFGGDNSVVIT